MYAKYFFLNKQKTDLIMKKKITKSFLALLGLIMFANILAMGQTTEKVVGNGTANGYIPIYPYYNYSYSQTILMPYEVGFAGQITKIKYKFAGSAADFINSDSITLYMGHTTKETFTSNTDWIPISSLTQKFKGKITYLSTNWVEITLSSPFTYNGTSNLAIAVEEDRPDCTASAQFFNSTQVSGGARSIYFRSDTDNPNPASPPTAYSRVSQIPTMNIVFTGAVTPTLDITKVITLYVNAGDSINLQFRAYNANTPVRIVSGNTTRNLVVGTTSSPSAKYYAESNIMKIYGDLDRFECYTAPIYHMAISNNHNIKIISAIGTRLSKGAIDDLYCMLPNRPSSDPGILWLLANTSDTNSAKVLATNSNNAANKNWRVQYGSNNTLIPTTGTFACGSPTVNMNRFITLNLNTNLQHNITRNEGITTNTYVRVISGSLDTTMIPNGSDYFISNSNTITFYGDIKVLDLDEWAGITTSMTLNNDVLEDFYIEGVYTSLDFSGAPNIKILNVGGSNLRTIDISALDSLNEIGFSYANFSPSGIDSIYCALPDRTGLSAGKVDASHFANAPSHPNVLLSNKANATSKNWNVMVGGSYTAPTNGTYVCGGPIVTTNAASSISSRMAILSGTVNPGTNVIAERGFEWKKTVGGTYVDLVSTQTGNTYTASFNNFTYNTSYTFRAYVKVGTTKIYGNERTFTTTTPSVSTNRYFTMTGIQSSSLIELGSSYPAYIRVVSGTLDTMYIIENPESFIPYIPSNSTKVTIYGYVNKIYYEGPADSADFSNNNLIKDITLLLEDDVLNYLNITGLNQLENFNLFNHNLTSVNFSTNTQLKKLFIASGPLASINLTGLSLLEEVSLSSPNLLTVNLNNRTTLKKLDLGNNPNLCSVLINGCDSLNNISFNNTNISPAGIDSIYCALPNRTGLSVGKVYASYSTTSSNHPNVLLSNKTNATTKNWNVYVGSQTSYTTPTNGTYVCGSPIVDTTNYISFDVQQGQGFIEIDMDAINAGIRITCGTLDTTFLLYGNFLYYFIPTGNTLKIYGNSSYIAVAGDTSPNSITGVSSSNHTSLTSLNIRSTLITSINLSNIINLKTASLSNNANLTSVNINGLDSLQRIDFENTGFSAAGIDSIYCALPNRTGLSVGKVYASNSTTDSNHPNVLLSNKTNATTKNWNVYVGSSTSYTTPTNGTYVCGGTINTGDVLTLAALDITTNSAKLRGAAGGMTYGVFTGSGFEWKETNGGTYTDLPSSTSLGAHTKILTGLSPNTSYTYRAYGIYNGVKKYGTEVTFTTLPVPVAATVTTNAASDIAQTLATLNGEVNPGTDVIAEKGFEWKLTTGGTYADEVSSSTGNTFTASLTGLTANTSYTFRAYVKVGTTKIYGSELTFTTSTAPVVATVTTNAATYIIQNSATLNGEVIPGTDAIDERGFEWKETIGGTYNDLVSMDLTNTFSVQLPGLTAGTSYTFKAYVFAGGVRIYGSEQTFTTLPDDIITSITTDDATDITAVSANLNATITPANDEVVTARGFEWKLTTGGTYSELYTAQTTDNYSVGINGLEANTSYTFKAFIMVNGNRIEGQEKVFVTLNGLNEVEGNIEIITIYPNPVSNTLYIECENEITKATLYDMNGRKIFEGENVSSIDASQLSKGIYSLRVVTNKSTRTFKVIKQ